MSDPGARCGRGGLPGSLGVDSGGERIRVPFPRAGVGAWGGDMGDFNVLAAFAAGIAGFFVGGVWYAKRVFGTVWGKANGYFDEAGNLRPEVQAKAGAKHPGRAFLIAIPFSIAAAFALAYVLGPHPEMGYAVKRALLFAGGFVATSFGVNYQFCIDRNLVSWAVDAGYHVAQFTVFAVVLALWH